MGDRHSPAWPIDPENEARGRVMCRASGGHQ